MRTTEKAFWALAILLCVVVVGFLSGIRLVDQGEVCAVATWGKITHTASPGFTWRWPLVQFYHCYSTRAVVYETSDNVEESDADYKDFVVEANTTDGQQIGVKFSISIHINEDDSTWVYTNVGKDMPEVIERVVKFYSRSVVRLTMQEYQADQLYTGDVFEVQSEIEQQLNDLFEENHVVLNAFVLRKIDFDPDYVQTIEAQQIAKEKIETAQYDAKAAIFTAQQTVELSKGTAGAVVEKAKGDAQAVIINAEAEAKAIALRGQALEKYPQILQLNFIEMLQYAQFMFFPSDTITPFFPLPPTTK